MAVDVLIVDDSAAIRKILQRVLQQADLPVGTILEAKDGVEALQTLAQHPVGLVLSDINMPNMDGMQLLTQIRADQKLKNIPILMITTEGSQARVLEAVSLGAAGYVRKPFSAEQIKEKLANIL